MILRKAFYLARLNRNAWKTKEKIAKFQLKLLKRIVTHAYQTVPYYRDLFQSANLSPPDIKKLEDINKIPITRKDDLRRLDIIQRLSSKYSINNLTSYKTGGTTGKVVDVFTNNSVADLRASSIFRTYLSNGYKFKDKIGVLQFSPLKNKLIYKLGILQRIEIPFKLSLDRQLNILQKLNPEVIEGYPSRLGSISRKIIRNKIKGITPKLIITNSETLSETLKNDIVSCFGIQPTNVYDSWEFGNIAWECQKHEGLHINEDLFKVEILKNGKEVTFNEPGEIIVTDLYNRAMPLIRYGTGDIGVKTNRLYSCGRTFSMINGIIGRTCEKMFLVDGTEIYATTAIGQILKDVVGVLEYQVIQKQKGELEIMIIADEIFDYQKEKKLKEKVHQSFKLKKVEIRRVQNIKKTAAGKHVPFISEVKS
ncbi:MAG: phenylacetate--CoA ligase family protein [Candidatus Anammoxibacter sp.]